MHSNGTPSEFPVTCKRGRGKTLRKRVPIKPPDPAIRFTHANQIKICQLAGKKSFAEFTSALAVSRNMSHATESGFHKPLLPPHWRARGANTVSERASLACWSKALSHTKASRIWRPNPRCALISLGFCLQELSTKLQSAQEIYVSKFRFVSTSTSGSSGTAAIALRSRGSAAGTGAAASAA